LTRKNTRNEILKQASSEKKAATTLQNVIRNKNAKKDMMKQRMTVREAELKQMEAVKDKAIKDNAAIKLQASMKRIKPQNELKQVKQAKEKIGAVSKRLLTEMVDSFYVPDTKRSYITNKTTVGQPLVISKKLKLVSKKRHDAGVFGYETRQDYLDLAKKYENVMTKKMK
jgi:hypothetical protein